MNPIERISAAIQHKDTDRIPICDAIWPETLREWKKQGFPEGVSPEEYFGYDVVKMFLDCSPRFEQKIIQNNKEGIVFNDRYGYTAFRAHEKPTLDFREHRITDKDEWLKVCSRWKYMELSDSTPARVDDESYFMHFKPYPTWTEAIGKYERLRSTGKYLLFANYGPWEATWRHRGYENLLMDLALDPDWVAEMAEAHHKMTMKVLKHCLYLGIKPNGYITVDDLAANQGPLFSPDTWRRIFKPFYRELGNLLKQNGIDFWQHCCGNPEILFDDMIECGVQVINPLQASAGLDIIKLKEKYRNHLTFCGNINCQLMGGTFTEIKSEIINKITAISNGYIYHSDHSVPSNVSLERYKWIINFVKNIHI